MADDIYEVTMPKLGETVTEGTVSAWLKAAGDPVAFDDPLLEVSTDKVDTEIPSPYDGVLLEILVLAGETVPTGTPLGRIGPVGAAASGPAAAVAPPPVRATSPVPVVATSPAPAAAPPAPAVDLPVGEVHEVTMPKLGETVTEGTVSAWLKAAGDPVAFDDPLLEVSTDKVDSEIPSPYDGVLLEILVPAGETVPVGTPLVRIGQVGAAVSPTSAATRPAATITGAAVLVATVPAAGGPAAAATGNGAGRPLSPVVRRLASERGVDLSTISGSGGGGRIMREDVLAAIAAGPPSRPGSAAPPTTSAPAVAVGVARPAPAAPAAPAAGDREEVVPLSRIRLVTAERMLESRRTSPHVWTSAEVDLERIEQIRQRNKEQFRSQEGASLTYLPFIVRATCDALREFPAVNASLDLASKTMTLHRYVNLAIAVDLNEQGLMAPVIKGVDGLNLRGVARAIKAVGDAAKNKKLKADDLSGSTFTITNPGPLGSFASAAIINQPNVAIMSTEGVSRRPTAVGDAIAIHHMCILGFSYDHRAFDGVTASRFLMYVRDALQDRDWEGELG